MQYRHVAAIAVLSLAPLARPCISVGPPGYTVGTVLENALIIWDAKTKTEQFIREAQFDTSAPSIGFIVPTPSRPQLTDANPRIFGALESFVRDHKNRGMGLAFKSAVGASAAVEVLERKKVGDLDAAVLRAGDSSALVAWLKKHGYGADGRVSSWLQPYVSKGWIVTAFKLDSDDFGTRLSAVRMSFKTDQPFYPYREPASTGVAKPRILRLFVISDQAVAAQKGSAPWDVSPDDSSSLSESEVSSLSQMLPGVSLPDHPWLTAFDDQSSPRIGMDDLRFRPDPSSSRSGPTWIGAAILAALLAFFGLRRFRRTRT